MADKITAPWTIDQVDALNRWQWSNFFHPFTCGLKDNHPELEGVLTAAEAGWECPVDGCTYTQDWAHAVMASGVQDE